MASEASQPHVQRAASGAVSPEVPAASRRESASGARLEGVENPRHVGGVTPRVVVLCLALALAFGYIIPIIDAKMANTFLGAAHLPPGAIAVLLILLLVINPILKMISGRLSFSRNEVLTVYITCLFSCLTPGHGAENFFVTNIIGPFYFAKPENKWLDFLTPNVKSWFTPALAGGPPPTGGNRIVQDWYTGIQMGKEFIPWGAWMLPLMTWGALIFASYLMLGCWSVMLRAQWAEREALAFPLLRIPLELTEDVDRDDKYGVFGRFFRNPLMWIGFGIAASIQLMNGLNTYYPDVPLVPLGIPNINLLLSDPPWNQLQGTTVKIFPIAVGITYLLTSEVSFSLWFFYWFMKFQYVGAYYMGFVPATLPAVVGHTASAKTFVGYQQIGAYLGYVGIVLWTGREHLRHIARRAFGRVRAGEDEKREAMSYPFAFWGFVLSFLFLVGWSVAAGISVGIALFLWLSYLVIATALTRVIVEGGLLFVQQGWVPLGSLAGLINSGPNTLLPASSLVPASFIQGAMMTDMRAFLMPSFLQSFKLAHDRKINSRALCVLIFAVTGVALTTSLYMNVKLGYENGGLTLESWFAQGGAQKPAGDANLLIKGLQNINAPSAINWIALGIGALATWGMMAARSRFLWFPLHPIGVLMSLTYPMAALWFSIFLGWMFKVTVTRFGGNDTYRKTTPLFLGLAVGDVFMMLVWLIVDALQVKLKHQLMPG